MTTIAANLQAVRARIASSCLSAGRGVESVRLLAVSKTWSAAYVREAAAAGQFAFGENYAQEAIDKMLQLQDIALEWHFIGPLQSNKTKLIAENFDWVHSVDRLKIADRLSEQRPDSMRDLNVCLQVNVSGEASKSGCTPAEVLDLASQICERPRLQLRGLMAIPAPGKKVHGTQFSVLRQCFEDLNGKGFAMDTLSMGMSDDLEVAILEGSTMVRIGTAIFGQR